MNVKQVMRSPIISLHPKNKISEAEEIFRTHPIHHIPIVAGDELVGIISMGDLLLLQGTFEVRDVNALAEYSYKLLTVDEIMVSNPFSIDTEKELEDVINLMISKRVNAVPIVDGKRLIGLITSFDIIKLLQEKKILNYDAY